MIGFFIFHRDLRIHDNIGLQKACGECDAVYCFFIFDSRQVLAKKNLYFSENSFSFMINCLQELKKKIPMHFIYDSRNTPAKALRKVIDAHFNSNADKDNMYPYLIYSNADYTPFAIARDKEFYDEFGAQYKIIIGDLGLNSPLSIKPYKVYTPYYNAASAKPPLAPQKLSSAQRRKIKSKAISSHILYVSHAIPDEILMIAEHNKLHNVILHYRDLAQILRRVSNWAPNEYGKNRDDLNFSTSRLSPYMKFGIISARQVYYLTTDKTFRKQLYWRDFYTQIVYYFPNVMADYDIKKSEFLHIEAKVVPVFEAKQPAANIYKHSKNFREPKNADRIWLAGKEQDHLFSLWCDGKTGVPIVDACMRQLNETGFMHNRGRLIVSSYLTKILHIDWRRGEQYFAQHLTDYDPALNNGNWQWSAGTGADAQPFFRIFNPYTQGKKHDPQATFIKKYLPELKDLDAHAIHKIESKVINYEKERAVALKLYGI